MGWSGDWFICTIKLWFFFQGWFVWVWKSFAKLWSLLWRWRSFLLLFFLREILKIFELFRILFALIFWFLFWFLYLIYIWFVFEKTFVLIFQYKNVFKFNFSRFQTFFFSFLTCLACFLPQKQLAFNKSNAFSNA